MSIKKEGVIHKNKFKMDERPKYEIGNHQNPTEENRQQPLWPRPQQFLTWHVSENKGNKSKNELLGPHQDKNLLHRKGNNQQNYKATNRIYSYILKLNLCYSE